MVKSIESYISETTKSYQPATDALNKQLSGLSGQTANTISDIENQFANQRSQLLNQANQAAEAASLTAAGNGGSFGGAANEANRKYYERSFMPAMTSSNTNRNTAISQARANEAQQRSNLEQQLANLYSQANAYGMQRYDQAVADEEARRQFEAQLALERERLAQAQKQFEAEMAEKQRQFNESLKKASSGGGSGGSSGSNWQTYYNQAGTTTGGNTSNTITGRRVVQVGATPVRQVQINGRWVNESDLAKSATSNAVSSAKNILSGLFR